MNKVRNLPLSIISYQVWITVLIWVSLMDLHEEMRNNDKFKGVKNELLSIFLLSVIFPPQPGDADYASPSPCERHTKKGNGHQ